MAETIRVSSKKPLMMLLGVIVLSFIFLMGYSLGVRQSERQKEAGYQEAVAQMKEKLAGTGLLPPVTRITNVIGTVTAVGADSVDIEVGQLILNPLENQSPLKRHVRIGPDTKINKTIQSSPEEMEKEMERFEAAQQAFDKAMRAGQEAEPPRPPEGATLAEIKLADIKVGDQIRVAAAADITYEETFDATDIAVLSSGFAAPPAPPVEPTPADAPPPPLP